MAEYLSPQLKRNILRVLPFGLIWLITGWVFLLVELAAIDGEVPPDGAVIDPTLEVFLFASVAVFSVGLLVGALEMVWMANLFTKKSFAKKIIYKLLLYLIIMIIAISIFYPIAASLETNSSLFGQKVWIRYEQFLLSNTFLSTLLQMAFSLLLCFVYAGISENLGHSVLTNLFTGKYHTPKEETRIFMFLDMKSSTAVAEKIGHHRYFELLKNYYKELSNAIVNHFGEVYQYVGDEVVITWPYENGIRNDNCVRCFFAMKKDLENRNNYYKENFDIEPTFKAGLHFGKVTTGEIGALKKEIIFTGDVLNTTARIQALCNELKADLLISNDLKAKLELSEDKYVIEDLGEVALKGKKEPISLSKIVAKS